MTSEELRALGLAAFGPNWQSPLARAIGITVRHMGRLASGKTPISEGKATDIRNALGAPDMPTAPWPRDEWIIGDGPPDPDTGYRREYITHTHYPRFTARIVVVDDNGLPDPHEEPADVLGGVTFSVDSYVLCEIQWRDPPPPPMEMLKDVIKRAWAAIEKS
jgi:hypothetical protein